MRFIHLFLIGYFVLILGAVMALWKAGVLAHVSGTWFAIGTLIAVGLGIMLAVSSGKPEITREIAPRPFALARIVVSNALSHARLDSRSSSLTLVACFTACKDGGTIKVHSLSFVGVKAVDENRLKDALATHQSSKIPWGKKAYFDRSRFDADLKRIQAFYADRGFPDARVTGFDVKLNDKQDSVDLTVTIAEGAPVIVKAIDFSGFEAIPAAHLDDLKKRIPLKVGQPRDRQLVVSTHEMAVNELKDHGFPYGKVTTGEDDGSDGKQAVLTFAAEPGKLAHFGTIEVVGNKSVDDQIIRRQLTFKPGALFQRSVIQDSQRRLYGLELFQFANVEPLNQEQQPEEVPVRVTVAEGNHQRMNFGVGYGTEEKARVDAEYHHLNFFGDARTAGAHVRWSSLDRGVRLDFNQPYFFRPHFSLGAEGQRWYTFTPAYNSVVSGAKLTVTHRANEHTSISASITSEHDVSSITDEAFNDPTLRATLISLGFDPRTREQNGNLNAFGLDFQHTTADNLLNAHRGYQLALHAEEAGQLVPGSFNYYSASGDVRHYLPFGDNIVLASRLQIGDIDRSATKRPTCRFRRNTFSAARPASVAGAATRSAR